MFLTSERAMTLTLIDYHQLSNLYKRSHVEPVRTGDRVHIDMIFDGSLDECVREFMDKPINQRPLYEVHTVLQPALEKEILSATDLLAIASRADFPRE
jgi:hypothetical protein